MGLKICNTDIEAISIIDDNQYAREAYELPVEELDIQPYTVDGPIKDLESIIKLTTEYSQAAICDHNLTVGSYAKFDGAELVAQWYQNKFPAILCTRYDQASLDEMRRYRKHIPVLVTPDNLDPDVIRDGIEKCIKEFKDEFQPSRQAWRALVRVDDVQTDTSLQNSYIYVVVPSWSNDKVIRLMMQDVPEEILKVIEGGSRLHAQVNLGAESQSELYFTNWEVS